MFSFKPQRLPATLLKLLLLGGMVAFYMGHASLIWIFVRDEWAKRRRLVETIAFYCRFAVRVLNIRVSVVGQRPENHRGIFLVGNHLSYADILSLSSVFPSSFVTSMEMKKAPFLGQICRAAGCVFVDRKNRMKILGEISEIVDGLRNQLNVLVFPEATSTNGDQVLRFRRPLFAAAEAAGAPILPFCVNYTSIDGAPVNVCNRDLICWYGDMGFVAHLWRLVQLKEISVEIHFLPMVIIGKGDDLAQIAALSQSRVESVFRSLGTLPSI